jgi:NAD(P)-dependent dehydrogenase (short-subunit alcohol dehydrogenase family)
MKIEGKIALLTGGARMGQTVAEQLGRRGCHIVMIYRQSKKSAEETIQRIKASGVDGMALQADLQEERELDRAMLSVRKRFGHIDILINMASSYEKTPFQTLGPKDWHTQMHINLQSAYLLSLKSAALMRSQAEGRIIHFSDWVAASGRPRYKEYLPYYVSKMGIIGLTEALALELAPDILVNAIAPGPILAPSGLTQKENREVKHATPLKRWGGSMEIAKAVLFLIETDFITGECIRVDGGRHLY